MSITTDGTFCGPCFTCKSQMWLPQALYDAAQHAKEKITFYCAYGHPQVFVTGEHPLDVVRRERDRALQRIAEKDDELRIERDRVAAAQQMLEYGRKMAAKAKKRAASGVCPCCNRTFRQMALHMKNQHPEFKAEATA